MFLSDTRDTEHGSIESLVILESPSNAKTKAMAVYVSGSREIADRLGYPRMK